jgi:16S rRNA (cytidine1402-2'-O)-methyltransferase
MSEKKQKSSFDYSRLAQKVLEASGDDTSSKLAPGLYIVATPIGHLGDISLRALMTLAQVDKVLCEDTRTSGALLAKCGLKKALLSYHDHNDDERRPSLLKSLKEGESLALISDAGLPLIADPGYKLVRDCREVGYKVTVIPGANAALTALVGSGLPTDLFHFIGFLPPKKTARQKVIGGLKALEGTLLFYEAPQRLAETLDDLASLLGASRPALVARELTKLYEEMKGGTLGDLATFYADQTVKGEIVLVVGPGEALVTSEEEINALLKQHLKTLSVRDAVSIVSTLTGHKKNDIYARALAFTKKKPNDDA